ncbi:immunoglobulin superfamily member 10-like isoform X4 [Thunnus maccoyii]|uniref:immunoglobulin superfamily member 10-like isoform X4 n=1 Tax=Thunnus maccoyii TaxID=8240 RepID=UPI001C4A83B9|nr:immunoglobulin superfamily member 10-like isoform X4 [Thunnus maccoyii]
MFSLCYAFLAVSLLNSLHDFHVSSCDESCADKPLFTPSRLVVKFGDPTSATCSACQHTCPNDLYGLENSVGVRTKNGTTISWEVDSLTEWDISPMCYYTDNNDNQCCSTLPVTVYQPPKNVSFSFLNHAGLMTAGHPYTLQCHVQEVAPVGNLNVTFYRGQTELHRLQSNNTEKTPVNETFTLDITPSKEDDGGQYWCEAKLDLGPEGPQTPPVVESGKLTATVYYEPQLKGSSHLDLITVTKGDHLQLDCSAVGNPSPSYNWTLPSATGSPFSGDILTIESVTLEHKGQYNCSVHNNIGTVTVKFNVDVKDENCADKPVFTPSRLVVKFGDPTSATCLVCQHNCPNNLFGLKKSAGQNTITTILWKVDSLTEWDTSPVCDYTGDDNNQCCSTLPVTVYQPPKNVSFSFLNHSGPMTAGHLYTLQCNVQEVAPVANLNVNFYRGRTELGQRKVKGNLEKKPVTETFTLDITPSKEDDGEQYWCEAKLDLGPEGPQTPPVVESGKLSATVYYEPQLKGSSHPDLINVTKGDRLQLDCSAVGNPSPSYNWMLPSASGSPFSDDILTIESVSLEHKGQYICSVHNNIGTVTVKFNVDVKDENSADKPVFTPSRLVVKFGDPASAKCLACQNTCPKDLYNLEKSVGNVTKNGTTISWEVDSLTEWDIDVIECYYTGNADNQCRCTQHVTVYQPPKNVSFSFLNHAGPMTAGHQYTLQCHIQEVAPVGNLNVIFYRGQTELHRLQSNNTEKTPVTETFTLDITPSKEDDGGQYWCEAKLDLGPEGPQPPPVVESGKLKATIYYEPQLKGSSHPDLITVTKGDRLQLNCSAVGNPSPSYNWTLPSASGSPFSGDILTIESVTLEHKGQYNCSVHNNIGTVTVKFNVDVKDENCADKPVFTPSRLVVKFGDPTSATCLACQHTCPNELFGLEKSVGAATINGTTISWDVDSVTEWDTSLMCYYTDNNDNQCCSTLPVTVYQPPKNVSFSFLNHSGSMTAGHLYTLQCHIQEVAPVGNLNVIFYRGQTELGRLQSNNTEKTPVTETFTLDITPSKEDDGGQYWCEAKLDLGPKGPQTPPVVESGKLTATVYYEPQLKGSSHPDLITVTKGDRLQLNCSAVGNPSPSYNWTLPSASGSPFSDDILTIKSVTLEHKGQYNCSVHNNIGTVTVKFNVDVKENYRNIILAVVLSVIALAAIVFVSVYIHLYKHN